MIAARFAVLGVLGAIAIGVAGCGSNDSDKVPEGAAAQVGDASIQEAELNRAIAQRKAQAESQEQTFPEEGTDAYNQARQQALQELVLQRIVDFEAKKCGKPCQVTSKEVDAELDSIVQESFNGSQEDFDEFLTTNQISKPDARRIVRFNLQQEELFNTVTRGVRFTDADARKFYKDNKAQFETPAGREVSHILVAEKQEADSLRAEVTTGNFAQLARDNSTDTGSATQGGSLGRIQKGVFVPEFEEAAFALKDDEISDPVKTQFGWHIITVDVVPKQTTPFAKARQQIQQQQLQQTRQTEFNEWRDGVLKEWQERTVYASKDLEPPEPEASEPDLEDVTVEEVPEVEEQPQEETP
ncbi:MAG: peptidylprolyl isomerase [Thermoleophilia bacterium]|nr:peptidylprolyl isomerase [Thermoleophilia bacterium]MDH3724340.1 peptidylprolyl isomerase [Thermoleophilia bacterium]